MEFGYFGYNIIDLIIILIVMLFMIEGTVKGFVKSAFGLLNAIVSLIIAKFLYSNLAVILKTVTNIDENLMTWLLEKQGWQITQGSTAVTGFQASQLKIPELLHADLFAKVQETNIAQTFSLQLATLISDLAINILSFFIIFFAAQLIFFLLGKILNLFSKLPIVSQLNRFLGFVFGTMKAIVVLYIAFALLIPIFSLIPEKGIVDKINESVIGSELYNNNIIVRFMDTEQLFFVEPFENTK